MLSLIHTLQQWLGRLRPMRRLADAVFRMKMRRRPGELDRLSVARCQKRALLRLVHKARNTRFGLAHDFRRIRQPADFQRLVPLQTPASLWRDYWQPALPNLAGATWPGPISGIVPGPAANGDTPSYFPVTPGSWTAQRAVMRTALALACSGRANLTSEMLLETGGVCYLGTDSLDLDTLASVRRGIPARLLVGDAERLRDFFRLVKERTGQDKISSILPKLAAIVYTGRSADTDIEMLRATVGNTDVLHLESYMPPEGPVAVADPRHEGLRLVPDGGVYFEVIAETELDKSHPIRQPIANAAPGVPYALAVSTPAGLWACLTSARICFERLNPPLFRLVESHSPVKRPAVGIEPAASGPHCFPAQPPHGLSEPKPESWKHARRMARRLLSDIS